MLITQNEKNRCHVKISALEAYSLQAKERMLHRITYSLLGILKLDSVFKLTLDLFTYKFLNEKAKLPIIFL
jgi:hypothetical protein